MEIIENFKKNINIFRAIVLGVAAVLYGCSGMERSEKERLKEENAHAEFIYRRHDEYNYLLPHPDYRLRPPYPWEEGLTSAFPRVTKEYFRCRGSSLNPPVTINGVTFQDCGGRERHSLPLRNDKEFIYPILMELLNAVQAKTGHRVVITCGYRCPKHNAYADPSSSAQGSKHMLGAEVDFYVQGYENKPQEIIALVMNYFKEHPRYRGKKEYEVFQRYDKGDTNTTTPPWYNKEIFVKLYQKSEGRDLDNRHGYPYIAIQVRYDRDLNEKVVYTWPKANGCFKRN